MGLPDFLSAPVMFIVVYVLPFLAVLTLIVFIHELGHFQVARWCGINIETFSVGFGKALAKRKDRHGTIWQIGWIPLGGYVKFEGDANPASMPSGDEERDQPRSPGDFHTKPVSQRAAVVAAGPLANFLLAIAIFAGVFMFVGVPISTPAVDQVRPGSAAEKAGIKPGDIIRKIDGENVESFMVIQRIVSGKAGEKLTLELEREGARLTVEATPVSTEIDDGSGGKIRVGLLGITRNVRKDLRYEKVGPVEALGRGVSETWFVTVRTLQYVKSVLTGRESANQLAGPLRIAKVSGQAASVSLQALLQLAAVLSISIGLINLFPIPMLDGGHLLFYAFEAIRGRPLGQNVQELGFKVGLALVLALMIVATWNDIVSIISS